MNIVLILVFIIIYLYMVHYDVLQIFTERRVVELKGHSN